MSGSKPGPSQGPEAKTASVRIQTDLKGLTNCHLPRFSHKHGMVPKHYVMPWKQDMKYRTMAIKHAELVGIYSGATEDTLFWENSERHCHGEDRNKIQQKAPPQMQMLNADIPIYSHLSRYHKSMVAYGVRIKL
ncbi:sperm-associated microtubule inner protein 10 [Tiliqua scincoides]|uniref:sperm-associated microtubule inner protein 10 n=1 Tax=Tiliqua scincoides TaxID=71010 RepID=UPI003463489E